MPAAAAKIPIDKDELGRSPLVPPDGGSHAGGGGGGGSGSAFAADTTGSMSKRASATSGSVKNPEAFNIEGGPIVGTAAAATASCVLPAGADLDRRLDRHLLPALCCLSVVNYIDRTNLAFAASGLKRDVGISLKEYGIGSALLFVTYGAAQLPIAALSSRVGLVRTLGCACFLWGVVAASFAAVNSVGSFYACRLALGLAEAPTFPLIITILRSFHASDGAVGASYAYVHASTLIASVIGGPLAAAILSMGTRAGLESWRWLFIIEGILPMLLSFWIFTLPCSPATAKFLSPQQRQVLTQRVADARGGGGGGTGTCGGAGAAAAPPKLAEVRAAAWATLSNWRLWSIGLLELVGSSGRFGVQFFAPLIIERLLEEARVGKGGKAAAGAEVEKSTSAVAASAALSAIPFGIAAMGAVLNAAISKRCRHRKWFIVWPGIVCAAGLGILGPMIERNPAAAFAALVAGAMGFAGYGIVMSLPSTLVGASRTESALGYAHFTMLAMLGGFVGPSVLGALTQASRGSYSPGAWVLGAMALASTLVYAVFFRWLVPGG